MKSLPLGPVMIDVRGARLRAEDRELLEHPLTGAVILFARNYESPQQVAELCDEIRRLREPRLLIAVDHEGGRVQRFREGFSAIPPMRNLGRLWDSRPDDALRAAHDAGLLIALELGACGVDFSFAPVLDIDHGSSGVIGDRAFHRDPGAVVALGKAFIDGLQAGGMGAVGKHFPGHGFVAADSHVDVPVDGRSLDTIEVEDLIPFAKLAPYLAGVMPAHVIYSAIDPQPAGFSSFWLQDILRQKLGFRGVIFSDDLTMEGARVAGGIEQRALAAFDAGCEMVLVCNHPERASQLLSALERRPPPSTQRLASLQGRARIASPALLQASAERKRVAQDLSAVEWT
jgi:beta-N-acetylhexosaminidase